MWQRCYAALVWEDTIQSLVCKISKRISNGVFILRVLHVLHMIKIHLRIFRIDFVNGTSSTHKIELRLENHLVLVWACMAIQKAAIKCLGNQIKTRRRPKIQRVPSHHTHEKKPSGLRLWNTKRVCHWFNFNSFNVKCTSSTVRRDISSA